MTDEILQTVEAVKALKEPLAKIKALPFPDGHLGAAKRLAQNAVGEAMAELKKLIGQLAIEATKEE